MASREPLTEKERRQVQWAYHKGTKYRKQAIQQLFGRDITYASCLAMVDRYVREAELRDEVKSVAKPTEEELWDWTCCAAYHGDIWSSKAKGDIRSWVEVHCQVMGAMPLWERHGNPENVTKHTVSPPVPKDLGIAIRLTLIKMWWQLPKIAVHVLTFAAGILFDKVVTQLFP